jgi:hypothetical protein
MSGADARRWLEAYVEQVLTGDGSRDPARLRRYFEATALSVALSSTPVRGPSLWPMASTPYPSAPCGAERVPTPALSGCPYCMSKEES